MNAARDVSIILLLLAALVFSVAQAFDAETENCGHVNDIAQLNHCGRYVR